MNRNNHEITGFGPLFYNLEGWQIYLIDSPIIHIMGMSVNWTDSETKPFPTTNDHPKEISLGGVLNLGTRPQKNTLSSKKV